MRKDSSSWLRCTFCTENNANAILDLSTMNLDIFGINKINVSEVRDVVALPSNQKIVVQEGLNFSMEGRLIAGSCKRRIGYPKLRSRSYGCSHRYMKVVLLFF
ncbi:hypothetical protein N9Y89_01410 [bacterium]|nr:hypothetical protein [bacterium]